MRQERYSNTFACAAATTAHKKIVIENACRVKAITARFVATSGGATQQVFGSVSIYDQDDILQWVGKGRYFGGQVDYYSENRIGIDIRAGWKIGMSIWPPMAGTLRLMGIVEVEE
jgi:hypothetical protein